MAVGRGGFRLDVTLAAAPGEVLAVLGPNGSGKSTLLDTLAGLLRADTGTVELAGRTLAGDRLHVPPHQRRVGLVTQDTLLFPHLTVLANVAFGPRAHGKPRRAAENTARRWLSEVDASELAGRRPSTLSGGQAQRVALARALATEPDLLLLDEPFAALDVDAAPALRGLVRRVLGVAGGRRATVLVTHDPLDALVLADRVVVLDGGRIVEQGSTGEVLSRPRTAFTARVAGLNLITGTASGDGLVTADGTHVAGMRGEPLADGAPAVAVFLPSAVAVHMERTLASPRNVFPATVAGLEPHGDVIRVRARGGPPWVAGLAADLSPAAIAELALEPGTAIHLVIKATEVTVYGA
ncbi:sulfate/molybdate ABC transporter ATP-binding protein [Herbihabitans rhizosphaerae]|nr:ABC transporter ATP-binding protein [Herbihabitans rhizosphaerae]